MKLIEFDGLEFKIADEALLVRPIRELFQKDKSKKKEEFWRQLSYLWFMCDPRSSYMYLTDEEERAAEVRAQEGFDDQWKPSPLLVSAMEQYRKIVVTTSALLIEDIRYGINNVRAFFREADPRTLDEKGRPLYQISSVTSAIKQGLELSKMLAIAEKELARDFESENAARGNAEQAVYENI